MRSSTSLSIVAYPLSSPSACSGSVLELDVDMELLLANRKLRGDRDRWKIYTSGSTKKIKKFHLSFKKWKGQPMSGPGLRQPGCKWEWNAAISKFEFKGWFEVPSLCLKPGEGATIAVKANEFVRGHVEALLIDKMMWASLGDATTPPA